MLLLLALTTSLFMTGLIWFVQVVHYPLMRRVGAAGWSAYHCEHVRLTTRLVLPVMALEAIMAVWLLLDDSIDLPLRILQLCLLSAAWVSTALMQVPLHRELARGFDSGAAERLAATNWFRTLAWTARSGLLAYLMMINVLR